jgi:hypothetical protein
MLNLKYTLVLEKYFGLSMSSLYGKNKSEVFIYLSVTCKNPKILIKIKIVIWK